MPKDPNQLLVLAQKQNRLSSPDIQPWHMRISVKQFDPSGSIKAEGQLEEFWGGESKHKIIYTTPDGSVTEYATEKGMFRSAATQLSFGPLMVAGNVFTNPISQKENLLEELILKRETRKESGLQLVCVSIKGIRTGSEKREFTGPTYCFDSTRPALLSTTLPSAGTSENVYTRSNIQNFHGQYVPQDVELTTSGTRVLQAHLDKIEDVAQADDALFSPPPDAVLTPFAKAISLSPRVASANLRHATEPDYPATAKAAGITGTVVVEVKINKEGSVTDAKAVSGPKELQQAAMDAVRTWTYKPYLLDGEAIEVRTTVSVVFR
jgi:TonB family protein